MAKRIAMKNNISSHREVFWIFKKLQRRGYIAGKYDIEVLTLPRKKFYNVEIKQSSTTKYIIPL